MLMESTPRSLTFKDVLGIMRRQRLGMAIIILLGTVFGLFQSRNVTPMYETATEMLVDNGGGQGNDPVNQFSLLNPAQDLATQVQLIQSSKFINDSFNAAGIDRGRLSRINPENPMAAIPSVKVDQVEGTSVLRVKVTSQDPEMAKQLATSIPLVFLRFITDNRQQEVDGALKFLNTRLTEEKNALRRAELDLVAFKQQRTGVQIEGENVHNSDGLNRAKLETSEARSEIALIQERIRKIQREISTLPGNRKTPTASTNPRDIDGQRAKIKELEARREVLLETYMADAQPVREIDIQIAAERERLRTMPREFESNTTEPNPIVRSLEDDLVAARISLRVAEKRLDEVLDNERRAEFALAQFNEIRPKQEELERSVAERKSSIGAITTSIEELRVRRNSVRTPVTILRPAGDAAQVDPRTNQKILLGVLLGCFFAFGFAIVKDGLEDKLHTPDDVYEITGLPALGEIPALPRRANVLAKTQFNASMLESYRVLRFNLLFSTLEHPVKSIVITSSGPFEGKTELACNLAIAASGEGRRVILVDANLRNPMIHKKMNVNGRPGLTDVLVGEATLEESLHQTSIPGLQVLTCGSTVSTPAEILSSPQMAKLCEHLQNSADLVIFDSTRSLGYADAQVLSRVADSVLYVAKAGLSKRSNIRKGIEALRRVNARVLGVATSGTPMKVS